VTVKQSTDTELHSWWQAEALGNAFHGGGYSAK